MSHDTSDSYFWLLIFFLNIGSKNPFLAVIMLLIGGVLAYGTITSNNRADKACEEVAGANYDRIDGICYQRSTDGNLTRMEIK